MNISKSFLEKISKYQLSSKKCIVGVSGGIDSMVLAHLCYNNKLDIVVAHVNYNFRGQESIDDMLLVKEWCASKAIPYYAKEINGKEALLQQNLQDFARKVRYDFFEDILHQVDASYILVAHHVQDQIETVLLNLSKGTGIKGLIGMDTLNGKVLRPLLDIDKNAIVDYAKQERVPYRDDRSNDEIVYKRNAIRNKILPIMEEFFPNVHNNIYHTSIRLRGYQALAQLGIDKAIKKMTIGTIGETPFKINATALIHHHQSDVLAYEILQQYGFRPQHIDELYKLTVARQGASMQYDNHTIIKDKDWLVIDIKATATHEVVDNLDELLHYTFYSWKFILEKRPNPINEGEIKKNEMRIDVAKLEFPLIIRNWKAGDYFYPQGLNKKKKIAKFLIDEKVPLNERPSVKIITSGDYTVGVIGYRADHRFIPSKQSEQVLVLTYTS